jgi:glycogen synthase
MHPLVKTGGLADVTGALPQALAQHGVEVTTMLPAYPAVLAKVSGAKTVKRYDALFGGPARLLWAKERGLLLLDSPGLFQRAGGILGRQFHARAIAGRIGRRRQGRHGQQQQDGQDALHGNSSMVAISTAMSASRESR